MTTMSTVYVVTLACMACGRGHELTVRGMADLPPLPQRCEVCSGSVLAVGSTSRVIRVETLGKMERLRAGRKKSQTVPLEATG